MVDTLDVENREFIEKNKYHSRTQDVKVINSNY